MPARLLLMAREIITLVPDAMRRINWMPTLDDIPESCQACKFELPVPPTFIQESDWLHVSCIMCHQVDKKGIVQAEVEWLEIPVLEEYVSVETHSELCLKCHNTENVP